MKRWSLPVSLPPRWTFRNLPDTARQGHAFNRRLGHRWWWWRDVKVGPVRLVLSDGHVLSNLGTRDAGFLSPPRQRTPHSRIGSRIASMESPLASRAIFLNYARPFLRVWKCSQWMEAPYTWPRFLAFRPLPFSRVDVLENGRRLLRAAELFADMICPASHAQNLGKSPPVQFNTNVLS